MNFYYDITLDFLENNYLFYNVLTNDKFIKVKKIPLFQVENKVLNDLILNNVQVSGDFLELIKNKTTINKGSIEYATILADKNNAIAFVFDEKGNNIGYSSLSLTDELNLLEIIYTVKNIDLDYKIISKKINNTSLRQEEKIKDVIRKEITKLYQNQNKSKLQFLYLEWFDVLENDFVKIYQDMLKKLEDNVDQRCEKILKIIEMSYNNV